VSAIKTITMRTELIELRTADDGAVELTTDGGKLTFSQDQWIDLLNVALVFARAASS
jgi:hypothetical protein